MKSESQKRSEHILFLATENVILHVNQPYKIRQDMIESKNFIPEAFLMHQFHDSKEIGIQSFENRMGDGLLPAPSSGYATPYDPFSAFSSREDVSYFSDEDQDDEDEDWDEDEDEEWDDEDEEWDDEDEEWDDEDEEWDDEDEDLDEDEDWSDDDVDE